MNHAPKTTPTAEPIFGELPATKVRASTNQLSPKLQVTADLRLFSNTMLLKVTSPLEPAVSTVLAEVRAHHSHQLTKEKLASQHYCQFTSLQI